MESSDPKPTSEPPLSLGELTSLEDYLCSRDESFQRQLESVAIVLDCLKDIFLDFLKDSQEGIVKSNRGDEFLSATDRKVLDDIDREFLRAIDEGFLNHSATVALFRHSNALVDVLPPEADCSLSLVSQSEKPDVT